MMLIFVTFCVYQIADQITTLNLDNKRISKMINLSKLVNLRWASFNDNDISKVEGLDNCLKLEELSLNNNSICTLSGQSHSPLPKEKSHSAVIVSMSVFGHCFLRPHTTPLPK